jgi:hypothetical protein
VEMTGCRVANGHMSSPFKRSSKSIYEKRSVNHGYEREDVRDKTDKDIYATYCTKFSE